VAGATSASYKLTAGDVGSTVRVVVTAANAYGAASAPSPGTATVVGGQAPTNSALPSISGTPKEGQTLTISTGTWSGSPTSFAYQWQDCNTSGGSCVNVTGATGLTYNLGAGDVGHTIRAIVTAANAGGSTSASSAATATVLPLPPVNASPPWISGTAQEGHTLTASSGTWSGAPTSYAFRWQDCNSTGASCTTISGASASSYTVAASDVGHSVSVTVTATNAAGSASATSAITAVVTKGEASEGKLANTAAPAMKSGQVTQGVPLSLASTGTWSEAPTAVAYQWEQCVVSAANALVEPACTPIAGATEATYTPAAADAGYSIRARVIAHNGAKSGSAFTGYTVGVEPRYGNLYPSSSFWRAKLPASGTQLMPEQRRYVEGLEESWAKGNPTITTGANGNAVYWVPPTQPTLSQDYTGGKTIAAELESAFQAVPVAPFMLGSRSEAGGNGDKHMVILPGSLSDGREWDMFHVRPEVLYQPTAGTPVGQSEIHLTEAKANGFVVGARVEFDKLNSGLTAPLSGGYMYYVIRSSETGFEVSQTPSGPAVSVSGAELKAEVNDKVGTVNDVRTFQLGGALANRKTYAPGYYEGSNLVEGAWAPSPYNKEMWRWGSTAGGQPLGAGLITYEDFRKIEAGGPHPIEHALSFSAPARAYRLIGPASRGACTPGSCWSGNLKSDATEGLPTWWTCYTSPGPEGRCLRPPEGIHWRLKESTDCAKNGAGATASRVSRAVCEALKEYGAVMTDKGAQFQFGAQEGETLGDATAFINFNPYSTGPRWLEGKSGVTLAQEVPVKGDVEVMKGVEYCGEPIPVLKAAEGKIPATEEGGSGCTRPAQIE
jgi:hypothetical protein